MPLTTTAEEPLPVRRVSQLITQWIDRLGAIWVEGQVTQVTRRPGQATVFLVLRDPVADMSLTVTCNRLLLDAIPGGLREGAHVVVHAKPRFFATRGTFSLSADEIRPVGVGELLARLEQLRSVLAAEGLFAADRKRALPFLPAVVGLICGRASAAEKDVVENARRRWPAVRFRIEEVAVQGPSAVTDVAEALQRLDRDPEVDVIVITRGGGSIEDLLPFSNETLVRAVSSCRTPIVSAIGHEQDTPLLDLVADVRASTPTDAAKRVVPDVSEELERVGNARRRLRHTIVTRVDREAATVLSLRSRPCLAQPQTMIDGRHAEVMALRGRSRRTLSAALDRAGDNLGHTRARVTALSPAATLDRGYAVLQRAEGTVVRRAADTTVGEVLRARVAEGELGVEVRSTTAQAGPAVDGRALR
ncbi:MAG: exodeoxyribonuclease large subunit [Actinomycetota bacterium]|nr:exodeoxyribonuclease large subunit [Actinomycetota bacterium]